VGETSLHRIGPLIWRHAQHVADVVLLVQQLHVPRIVRVARCLQRLDLGQRPLVHLRHEHLLGIRVVRRDIMLEITSPRKCR
jgi:hypothetical protein